MNRRNFLTGLTTLLAAPAIVRVSAIMPVKALPVAEAPLWGVVVRGLDVFGNEMSETIAIGTFGQKMFKSVLGPFVDARCRDVMLRETLVTLRHANGFTEEAVRVRADRYHTLDTPPGLTHSGS